MFCKEQLILKIYLVHFISDEITPKDDCKKEGMVLNPLRLQLLQEHARDLKQTQIKPMLFPLGTGQLIPYHLP